MQKMRALMINAVCGIRSTGRICTDLAEELETQGYEVKIAYSRASVPAQYRKYAVRIGNVVDVCWHALMTRLFDDRGYWSRIATRRFLKWADEYNPDLLWLHNIHDYVINIEMLFDWIKGRPNMKVKWTQHDCWAFTGYCFHFTVAGCDKWKQGCADCSIKCKFPQDSLLKKTSKNFIRKKKAFSNVPNMTIIAVSHWLEKLLKMSYLNQYPIDMVYNKVNEKVFHPTESDFREKHGLKDRKIVLGVATAWNKNKGLYEFKKLAEMLGESYAVVLVGLNNRQLKAFSKEDNMLCLPKTNSAEELAQIYTAADVFVNLSLEETFGLTTLEAILCGTCVIVYKNTACEEVADIYGGTAVEQDLDAVYTEIVKQLQ